MEFPKNLNWRDRSLCKHIAANLIVFCAGAFAFARICLFSNCSIITLNFQYDYVLFEIVLVYEREHSIIRADFVIMEAEASYIHKSTFTFTAELFHGGSSNGMVPLFQFYLFCFGKLYGFLQNSIFLQNV